MGHGRATDGPDRREPPAGSPFADFTAAAQAVLRLLQDQVGLSLWMVTRAVGGEQVVLEAQNASHGEYGAAAGMVLPWDGSLCAEMVAGHGPMVAPHATQVPAYAGARNQEQAPIEAYVGVPMRHPDGSLFGTLCGFDPKPQPEVLEGVEDLVLLQAALLSTLLALELDREDLQRRAERAEVDANRDALTGLANRRMWESIVAAEETRSGRYGHPGCVLVLDLNDLKSVNDTGGHRAGDELLRQFADVLTSAARHSDFVARLGGDEFGVLAVQTDLAGGRAQEQRLREALATAGIDAAIGLSVRAAGTSFATAFDAADEEMYRDKERRRRS